LSRCRTFGTNGLGWRWLICIIFDAKIVRAAETGLALFKTVEIAILDHIAQICHSTPRITLSFDGRRENGCQSNDAERKKWKFHPLPRIPCLITGMWIITMSPFGDFPPPWSADVTSNCFIVRDANGQELAYVYYESEPGRQSAAAEQR
jgi:hypothetical protein